MHAPSQPDPAGLPRPVFGKPLSRDEIVGTVRCTGCRGELPYRLSDVGGHLVCPSCGRTGIRVGDSLLDPLANVPLQRPATFSVLLSPGRRHGGFGLSTLCFLSLAGLGLVASLVFTVQRSLIAYPGWLNLDRVAAVEGLHTDETEAGAATIELPPEPPTITLDAIEQLLEWEDLREAFVQAQVWQQMLQDFGVPEADPRLLRLAEIIRQLSDQFRPRPTPPPACLAEFRKLLDRLREALVAKDLNSGRELMVRAETLYEAHSAELSVYSRSYLVIRDRLRYLELIHEGRQRIVEHLANAEKAAPAGETAGSCRVDC
jgi:hypothetical protein